MVQLPAEIRWTVLPVTEQFPVAEKVTGNPELAENYSPDGFPVFALAALIGLADLQQPAPIIWPKDYGSGTRDVVSFTVHAKRYKERTTDAFEFGLQGIREQPNTRAET